MIITFARNGNEYTMSVPGETEETGSLLSVLGILMWRSLSWFFDDATRPLSLHGAGVVRAGRGMVISTDVGGGKSTQMTALLDRGFDYVTDDVALLDLRSSRLMHWYGGLVIRENLWDEPRFRPHIAKAFIVGCGQDRKALVPPPIKELPTDGVPLTCFIYLSSEQPAGTAAVPMTPDELLSYYLSIDDIYECNFSIHPRKVEAERVLREVLSKAALFKVFKASVDVTVAEIEECFERA